MRGMGEREEGLSTRLRRRGATAKAMQTCATAEVCVALTKLPCIFLCLHQLVLQLPLLALRILVLAHHLVQLRFRLLGLLPQQGCLRLGDFDSFHQQLRRLCVLNEGDFGILRFGFELLELLVEYCVAVVPEQESLWAAATSSSLAGNGICHDRFDKPETQFQHTVA